MHVDGFRFDLASALARELHAVDRLSSFFDVIQQDPVISRVKLIAEPWDVGEGGYQVGNFPPGWAEWNGRYRDAVRRFWRGDARHAAGAGDAAGGQQRSLRPVGPAAAREHQLRHRRTTGSRWPISSRTTRSTTRRTAKSNRDGDSEQPELELRRRRTDRRPGRSRELRARQRRNFLLTLSSRKACR